MRRHGVRPVLLGSMLALAGASCSKARDVTVASTAAPGPRIEVTSAQVADGHVVASYSLTQAGSGLGGTAAAATRPSWTALPARSAHNWWHNRWTL